MDAPKFLLRKKYLIESVLFVALFSFIFMAIYQPFSDTAWFGFRPLSRFLVTLSFYIVAVGALFLSRLMLYLCFSNRALTMGRYLVWVAGEFVALASIYTLFTIAFEMDGTGITVAQFGRILLCVALIMAIPYSLISLYTANREKTEELNLMRLKNVTEHRVADATRLVHFYDNNGVLKMSVGEDALYYIESQDNYVRIYYLLDEKLVSYMLRGKTQRIEEALQGTSLVRCHRSYIVNLKRINHYDNRSDRAVISLDHPSAKPIPVSKSYYRAITEQVASLEQQA